MLPICVIAVFVGLFPPDGASTEGDYTIAELKAVFEQNRRTFVTAEIRANWSERNGDEYLASVARGLKRLEERPEGFALPDAIIDALRSKASDAAELERLKLEYINEHAARTKQFLEAGTSSAQAPPQDYSFSVLPDAVEICFPFDSEPRRQSAVDRKIASFTGGDYVRAQRKTEGKWVALEPYPEVHRKSPVVWSAETLRLPAMMPPFVESKGVDAYAPDCLDSLFSSSSPSALGPRTGRQGKSQLVATRPSDAEFRLASVLVEKGAFPEWISTWRWINGHTPTSLNRETAGACAKQIDELHDISSVELLPSACPTAVVYFDAVARVPGAGWYPEKVTHIALATVRRSDSPETDDWRLLPVGWSRVGALEIGSIKANLADASLDSIALEKGTSFLDLDTKQSYIVGEPAGNALDRMAGKPQRSRRSWLLIINIVAVAAFAIAFAARRYFGKKRS